MPKRHELFAHVKRAFLPILTLATIGVYYRAWLAPGLISAGDLWYIPKAVLPEDLPLPPLCDTSLSTGSYNILKGPMFLLYSVQGILATLNLDWPTIERLLWIFPAIIIPFSSTYALGRLMFGRGVVVHISALAMVMNSYIYLIYQGGQFGVAVATGCIPLVFWAYLRGQQIGSVRSYLPTGLCISLQAMYDIRSTYLTIGILLLYGLYACIEPLIKHEAGYPRICLYASGLPHLTIALIVFASTHLWWLLPILLVHGAALPAGYTAISAEHALSYMHVSNGLALFHPFWFANDTRIRSVNPLFFVAPIVVFAQLLRRRIDTNVLFLAALAILGIFLVKGANDPAGNVYDWMFVHTPGFSYFRDPSKFFQLVAFAYALLLGVSASACFRWISSVSWRGRTILFALASLFWLTVVTFPAYPALAGQAGGTFASDSMPLDYVRFNSFIDQQPKFFRIIWAPARPRFATYSSQHPSLDAGQVAACCGITASPPQRPWLWLTSSSASAVLTSLAVRYVVIADTITSGDILGEPWPVGDPSIAPTTILAALRTSLAHLREFNIGRLHIFTQDAADALFYMAESGRVSYHCAANLPCYTALRFDRQMRLSRDDRHAEIIASAGSQTWHDITVHTSRSSEYLVFSQTYDPNWLAYVEPKGSHPSFWSTLWQRPLSQNDHVVANGYANAWLLRGSGTYHVVLEYWPQRLVLVGWMISALFLLSFGCIGLRYSLKHKSAQFMNVSATGTTLD